MKTYNILFFSIYIITLSLADDVLAPAQKACSPALDLPDFFQTYSKKSRFANPLPISPNNNAAPAQELLINMEGKNYQRLSPTPTRFLDVPMMHKDQPMTQYKLANLLKNYPNAIGLLGMNTAVRGNNNEEKKKPKPGFTQADVVNQMKEEDISMQANIEYNQHQLSRDIDARQKSLKDHLDGNVESLQVEFNIFVNKTERLYNRTIEKDIEELLRAEHNITHIIGGIGNTIEATIEIQIRTRILLLSERIQKKKIQKEQITLEANTLQEEIPPPQSICQLYVDCGTCLANPDCGWCANTELCMAGDDIGPTEQICALWDYKYCRGACAIYSNCETCVNNEACGWCSSTEKCLERPPTWTGCPADNWFNSMLNNTECPVVIKSADELAEDAANREVLWTRKEDVMNEEDKWTKQQQEWSEPQMRVNLTRLRQRELSLGEQIAGLTEEYKQLVNIIYHYEECIHAHIVANREAAYDVQQALKAAEQAKEQAEAAAQGLAANMTNFESSSSCSESSNDSSAGGSGSS